MSKDQGPIYLDALTPSMRDLATFMIDTGLRVGEAINLEWSTVNLRETTAQFRVRPVHAKNSKPRTVPLTPTRQGYIGLVFRRADGTHLSHTWLDQQNAKVRTTLKFPAGFVLHSLRHTFGTRLGETGADAFTIMELMGHSSVTVSQKVESHKIPHITKAGGARKSSKLVLNNARVRNWQTQGT